MAQRRCVDCKRITTNTRCPTCTQTKQTQRNARRQHYHGTYRTRAANLKRRATETNAPCWLCGQPIDWTATHGPWRYQADHIHPHHPASPLAPSHARCNQRRRDADPLEADLARLVLVG